MGDLEKTGNSGTGLTTRQEWKVNTARTHEDL